MNYRKLGKADIQISEWSLGCSNIGGPNFLNGGDWGWPEVSDEDVLAAVKLAVAFGVNHFDTADLYGQGRSERRIAWALRELGLNSDDFVISSKVGFLSGTAEHPYDPWHIKRQCEQSLRNLGRDYLDIYYLHNADFGPDDRWLEPAAKAIQELQQEGKIRLKGQSAYTTPDFLKTIPVVQPEVLQSRSNLIDDYFTRPGQPVSNLMIEQGLSFIAFSPLEQGLLSGAFHPDNPPEFKPGETRRTNKRFERPFLRQLQSKLDAIKDRFDIETEDIPSVAIRYVLDKPQVAAVINGFQSPADIRSSARSLDRSLSEADNGFLDKLFADMRRDL